MLKEESKFICSDLLEGMPSISALLRAIEQEKNDRRIVRIYFDRAKTKKKQAELRFLQAKAHQMGFSIELADEDAIDAMSIGKTHGGIVAECQIQ